MGFDSMDSLGGIYALVVDSEKERRLLVAGILRYCGALVTPAETPQIALSVLELLKPDVVVVDFSTPEDGGLTFIRDLRALTPEQGGRVPAVALGDGEDNVALARARGFNAYVIKPFQPSELCRAVATLVTA